MRLAWVALAIAIVLTAATPAHAYEFWLDSQTIGQAYQLPQYQLAGPSLLLGRRRLTQTLALRIWDIGDLSANRRKARMPDKGLRISLTTYLRVDHDFGDYTSGSVVLPGPVVASAIDVIPELADSSADLQLMYGYVTLEGLADDKLKVQLGRLLVDDGWGEFGVDGASARYELPMPLAVTATAGLRVRASSPLGVSSYELDGTSGAGCEEYVVGPTPGTGSWQLIDRNRGGVTDYPLSSNVEYCPQRDVDQPSVGVAIATAHTHGWGAEIGYRRTWSNTVGLIGPAQGVDQPPASLYPNEFGQAPTTGVDEERLYGRVHGDFDLGEVRVSPYADARYSILNAVFDRADAGVRFRDGDHILEPEVEYFYPDFDGDSIFNAFSIEATTDARLAYTYAPTSSCVACHRGCLASPLRPRRRRAIDRRRFRRQRVSRDRAGLARASQRVVGRRLRWATSRRQRRRQVEEQAAQLVDRGTRAPTRRARGRPLAAARLRDELDDAAVELPGDRRRGHPRHRRGGLRRRA